MSSDAPVRGRPWLIAAVLLSGVTAALFLFLPSYKSASPSGVQNLSLTTVEGPGVVALILLPVLVTAVSALFPRFAWAGVALLTLGAVLSLASIGLFLLPSVMLLAIGAARAFPRSV